jgi:hypothetical protein
LKWWRWKCSRFNSSQSWIGCKLNRWKWFTLGKHDDPRISTLREISIHWSDENENAPDSIRINRVCDSNVIISVFLSLYKDSAVKIVIDSGIHTRVEPRFFESKVKMYSIESFWTTIRRI